MHILPLFYGIHSVCVFLISCNINCFSNACSTGFTAGDPRLSCAGWCI